MKRYIWLMSCLVAMLLLPGAAWAGTDWDVGKTVTAATTVDGYSPNITTNSSLYLFSQSSPDSSWNSQTLNISSGAQLNIGDSNSASGTGKTLALGLTSVTLNTGQLRIITSTAATSGTTVTLTGGLDMSGGGTVTLAQGMNGTRDGWNKLLTTSLNGQSATGGLIDIDGNALLQVTNAATLGTTTGAVDLKLGNGATKGYADFRSGLTVDNGIVSVDSAGGNLAVGTAGLIVNRGGLSTNDNASTGGVLNIYTTLNNDGTGTQYANVQLGSAGNTVDVDIDNGGKINLADLATAGTVNLNGTTGANALNVNGKMTVGGVVNDAAGIATTVAGETTIRNGGSYYTAGTNNEYKQGITVENGGLLSSTGGATSISVGGGTGKVDLKGGSLKSGGGVFTVKAAEINITDANANALDATAGELDLATAIINVNATGPVGIKPDQGIKADGYVQTSGDVTVARTGGTGNFAVAKQARIGGGTAATTYTVGDDATHFQSGVRVLNNGVVESNTAAGKITVGTVAGAGATDKAGDVILSGGARLRATGGNQLTLADAYGDSGGSNRALSIVRINGSRNVIEGDVDSTKMDTLVTSELGTAGAALTIYGGTLPGGGYSTNAFSIAGGQVVVGNGASAGQINTRSSLTVRSTGVLASEGLGATVKNIDTAADSQNRVVVQRGGAITTRNADMSVEGYKSLDINGEYVAGWTGARTALLTADSDVNLSSTASVGLTGDAALNAQVNDIILQIDTTASPDAVITSRATLSDYSMFGLFGFKIDPTKTELYIDKISGKINGDYSDEDIDLAIRNLKSIWGDSQIGRDLGKIIYYASVENPVTGEYGIVADPADSEPGNKNIAIFQALASPRGKTVGMDTLEYINGAHNYGVADVAITSAGMFLNDMNFRARVIGCNLSVFQKRTGLSDEGAAQAMNQDRRARLWVGAFGATDDRDESDRFSGYKYDSTGFIMGYDRVVASSMVVGGSFAYTNGDYEDKGALDNNSEIASYSFGLYGSYSHASGLFATAGVGYTYSDNNIRALRRDPSIAGASWAEAEFNGNTWAAGLNLGYDYRPSESLLISPAVGINYLRASLNDHDTRLGGIVTQRETDLVNDALFLPVEVSAHYDYRMGEWCTLRFEGTLGYAYNFANDAMDGTILYNGVIWNETGGSVSSELRSREADRHTYHAGVGIRYGYKKFDIGARYDYVTSASRTAHRVTATAGVLF